MPRWLTAACAAAVLATVAVAGAANAAADSDPALPIPVPGEESAPPPPPDPVVTAAAETRQNPVQAMADLIGPSMSSSVLGQTASPAGPGSDQLVPPTTLLPQYYRMPTPDMTSPYLLTEDAPAGPFARVDAFKGVHALLHGALGRMPAADLGQPLPGTAPPPGVVIPAGPEQFLPDPAAPPPPPG